MSIPAEHLMVYARSLGLPEDSDLATVAAAIRACRAAGVARPDQIPRALCTERKATVANPPPIDRRTHSTTTALDARRRAHLALAIEWRNQPTPTSEIADRICAMAQSGDLVEFIGSISEADLVDLYRRMSLSPRTRRAAEVLYAACDLRALAQRYAAPLAHVAPPAAAAPALPTAGQLTAREREYCREFGTSEATYIRLRDERDRKLAAQKLAKAARLKADRAARDRALAMRGTK